VAVEPAVRIDAQRQVRLRIDGVPRPQAHDLDSFMRLARLVAALSLLATRPVTASATDVGDCQALLAQHMRVDLALSLDQFDQDDHQGWRPLSDAGCETEAATLIASYAAQHPHPVLTWHRAQMLAKAGKAAEAIEAARLTLRPPHSDDGSGFDWKLRTAIRAARQQ